MKFKLIFPVVSLLAVLLNACMTPIAPLATVTPTMTATAILTSTPTVTLTPTATYTPTLEPTPTPTEAPTATEEAVVTKEIVKIETPAVSLSERINGLDNLPQSTKDSLLASMESQFPLTLEYGAWRVTCIGGEIITHEPTIKLPSGKEISHTFACQYEVEGQGEENKGKLLHFPIYTYDLEGDTYLRLGYKMSKVGDEADDPDYVIKSYSRGYTERRAGSIGKLDRRGWSGPGHVFIVRFAYPEEDSENYLAEDIRQLISPEQLVEFARTGDPSLLVVEVNGKNIVLLLPDGDDGVSIDNTWGAEQKQNTGSLND